MYKVSDPPQILNNKSIQEAIIYLTKLDKDLASIVNDYGLPKIFYRKPGFSSLLYIILEQQVSLTSAAATFNRLLSAANDLAPKIFLEFSDDELKSFGFSRQKTLYCRLLARTILEKQINLNTLKYMNDDDVRNELMKLKGVGKWTADNYLMLSLRRADIFPTGDIALISTIKSVKKLPHTPDEKGILKITNIWRPWRSVAARILWHYYLSK